MPKIAVNVCDMSELTREPGSELVVQLLFKDFIVPPHTTVMTDPHAMGGGAAVLNGPAAQNETRLEAFIVLLQTVIGPRKLGRRVRCYEEDAPGHWKEIVPKKKEKRHA